MSFCPEAIILDMDGLLVDSEPVWAIAESAVLEARGRVPDHAKHRSAVGKRLDEYWAFMVTVYELTDEVPVLIEDVVERMCNLIATHVVPRPGAVELLDFAAQRHIPIAIASSSPNIIIDTVVEAKGWLSLFDIRVSGNEVERGKPAPDVYLEAARRLGVDPKNVLALEDSVNGAKAAVAAGMITYAVPDLSHAHPEQFEPVTPHVFKDLNEVRTLLAECIFA